MARSPAAGWIAALHASSRRVRAAVDPLGDDELAGPSFDPDWTIGQVLSHLGRATETCTELLRCALEEGARCPGRAEILPDWERWDVMPAPAQREAWHRADTEHLALLDSLDAEQRATLRVPYFNGPMSVATYAGYRLAEQSMHAWDIEVALDGTAAIPGPEVRLLWERIDLVATRFRDGGTLARLGPRQVAVKWTDPAGSWCLDLGAELHLYPCEAAGPTATVSGPAEALLRLVYGRNRAQDGVAVSGSVTLADLRALFPGY